jgi:hypothetical protein
MMKIDLNNLPGGYPGIGDPHRRPSASATPAHEQARKPI